MSEEQNEQGRLDNYVGNDEHPTEASQSDADLDDATRDESGGMEGVQSPSNASEWVETLRTRAIEDSWHLQQGKGAGDDAAIEQDLLSHTMDVVHVAYNVADGMGLIGDPPLDIRTILSVAFFHDLHKRPDVGGTVSMTTDDVATQLESWEIHDEVTRGLTLDQLADVLKSIHQYHGDSDSRAAITADRDLLLLTSLVELADAIASVGRLGELWDDGKYRSPFESLDRLSAAVGTGYTLGYHRLSTIRPALSSLVHQGLYEEMEERGAKLLATRADGAVYAIPKTSELVQDEGASVGSAVLERVAADLRDRLFSEDIREGVPDKLQEELYGLEGAVELRASEQRATLQREEGTNSDFEGDVLDIAQDLSDAVNESYDVEIADVEMISVDETTETVYVEHPDTEPGEVVGETLSQMMDSFGTEEDRLDGVESRLDTLNVLVGDGVDLAKFESVYWSRVEAQLARVVGNHIESEAEKPAGKIIDAIEGRAKGLISGDTDSVEEDSETTGLEATIRAHLNESVSIRIQRDDETNDLTRVSLPRNVESGLAYDECCIVCGAEADIPFRTTNYGEFKKSYLVRGEAGQDMTDANGGAWHLCDACFLDNTLFRAAANGTDELRDVENALFLKVIPNRYLGSAQAALLRERFQEGRGFGYINQDAERYLEHEYGLSDGEAESLPEEMIKSVDSFAADYRVDFTGPATDQSGIVIGSPHFFIIAVEDDDDTPTNQTTNTWLRAILRALILARYHNLSVVIDGQPTFSSNDCQLVDSGVRLNNPPSQVRSVFGDAVPYGRTDDHLTGLAALLRAEDTFPQYNSDNNYSPGPDYLTRAFDLFRSSLLPGSRMYRAAERAYEQSVPVGDYIDDAGFIADLLNRWRAQSELDEGGTVPQNDHQDIPHAE